jgi:hypothetical protein
MDPRLLELIRAFQSAASGALEVFLERAALPHPFDWRGAGLPRSGTLDGVPPIAYAFHGAGLRLEIGSEEIDFDFGFDGRTGGFNAHWLSEFAERHAREFPDFQDRAVVRAAVEAARAAGDVQRAFRAQQDDLDYLSIDVGEAAT